MTITNKKLLKNFKTILASSISAKEIVASEIEKVDEKYRKLAEAEKADLNAQLKALDAQIANFQSILGSDSEAVEETPATEEKVVDTVFPENNVEEDEGPEFDGAGFTDADNVAPTEESEGASEDGDIVWPEDEAEEQEETAEPEGETAEEDEWPDEPQEW